MKCNHRNSKLIEVKESKDGRKRYFFECVKCDTEWMEWGHKPKDNSTINDIDTEAFM